MNILIEPYTMCGMGGTIWQILRAIYHNPNAQYHVNLTEGCIYKDYAITHTNNPWEYYFEQPSIFEKNTKADKIVGLINDSESEYRDVYMFNPSEERIYNTRVTYSKLIQKFIKPLPHIKKKINDFNGMFFSGKKILGAHLRGTDHPGKLDPQKYLATIRNMLPHYDMLFICSDEQERVDLCIKEFKDKVITYDSLRSNSPQCLHVKPSAYNYQYKIGEDVIIEAYLMSKVDFLLCCTSSNINYFARAISPNLKSHTVV